MYQIHACRLKALMRQKRCFARKALIYTVVEIEHIQAASIGFEQVFDHLVLKVASPALRLLDVMRYSPYDLLKNQSLIYKPSFQRKLQHCMPPRMKKP